jgi:hypothetical protein
MTGHLLCKIWIPNLGSKQGQSHGRVCFSTTAIVFIFKHLSLESSQPEPSHHRLLPWFSQASVAPRLFGYGLMYATPTTDCLAYLGSYFWAGFRFSSRKGFRSASPSLPLFFPGWNWNQSMLFFFSNHTITRQQTHTEMKDWTCDARWREGTRNKGSSTYGV